MHDAAWRTERTSGSRRETWRDTRSPTFSETRLPSIERVSHDHVPSSSTRSSESATKSRRNWRTKKGLPNVLSSVSWARSFTVLGGVCNEAAIQSVTSASRSGSSDTDAACRAVSFDEAPCLVARTHLVVAPREDEDERGGLPRVVEEGLQQAQRRPVGPLQVVDEQHERVLGAGHRAQQRQDARLQSTLRVDWRDRDRGVLRPDEQLELGHQLGERPRRPAEFLVEHGADRGERRGRQGEHLSNQLARGLDEGRVRQVAAVEVELAGREPAVGRGHRPLQFIDEPRLADARVAGDEHQVLLALGGGREAVEQGGQLGVAPEQHVRHAKPGLDVAVAQRELGRAALAQVAGDGLEVGRHRRCRGVAVLGILVEQPVEQVGEQRWAPRTALVQARRAAGDVRMHQRAR